MSPRLSSRSVRDSALFFVFARGYDSRPFKRRPRRHEGRAGFSAALL